MSESITLVQIILTSSVIASIVAAFVATWTAQRKISIENITQERTKWREKIRVKSEEVHLAIMNRDKEALEKLHVEFSLILNPSNDKNNQDLDILRCIRLPEEEHKLELSNEFTKRTALLLKHDWDRVKKEAGPLLCRIVFINKLCEWLTIEVNREEYNAEGN